MSKHVHRSVATRHTPKVSRYSTDGQLVLVTCQECLQCARKGSEEEDCELISTYECKSDEAGF